MKTQNLLSISGIVFLLLAAACQQEQDPLAHIKDAEIKTLLGKIFDAHGGLENWNAIRSLKYNKSFSLFAPDSTVEKSAHQFHHYNYWPEHFIKIHSTEGSITKRLVFDNNTIQEMVNGTVNLEAKESSLMNQMYSSTFVIAQPFCLATGEPQLSMQADKTLHNGQEVKVLRAIYDPEKNHVHTTPDIWDLYFDSRTHLLIGYQVQHKDHVSLIENLETTQVNGFTFPKKRNSYRVNAQGEITLLRATYEYSDFKVN